MVSKGPKPWKLTEEESITSYTSWQYNMEYTLSKEKDFKPFLCKEVTWQKHTTPKMNQGIHRHRWGLRVNMPFLKNGRQ